ncbi:acetyl-CoA C-acyltransferase [Jatrophihabitans sp.]|uniref:thiolase family protein n=1 Tax=Jatrophihabitans sp. TaxID=1932789 RepID=UPI0030C6AA8E|nr:putative acetyl-CoA acyltransferase [Jatrophihabitans sp.]
MRDAVIVDAVRTPLGRRNGSLAGVHPVELSSHVLRALVGRTNLDPADVEDVIWGVVNQVGDQSVNVARSAVLGAGWPESVPGVSLDRQCGSSQQAVHFAAAAVISGQYDIAVAGGVESMSRVPMGSSRVGGQTFGPGVLHRYGVENFSQGLGAEMIAVKWAQSRTELDQYALESHERAAAAIDSGALAAQLAPLPGVLDMDECVRRGSNLATLGALKPVFSEDGVVTAGNSSQISDGASALLITTSEVAAQRGLRPLARIKTAVVVGDDPVVMLAGVIPATAKALSRAGLTIDDIGAFEVNEAFAPVPLAWIAETGADPARVNPLGGAISVGHPLGGSGGVLMARLAHHMRDNGIRYGLQTMCEGGGMANATILELV